MSFPSSSEARLCYGGMPIWRSDYAPKCLLSKSPNDGTNRLRRSRRIEWCHHKPILRFEVWRNVMTFGGMPWILFWKLMLLPIWGMTIWRSDYALSCLLSKSLNDGTNRLRRLRRIEWCHHLEILRFEVWRKVMSFWRNALDIVLKDKAPPPSLSHDYFHERLSTKFISPNSLGMASIDCSWSPDSIGTIPRKFWEVKFQVVPLLRMLWLEEHRQAGKHTTQRGPVSGVGMCVTLWALWWMMISGDS